MNIDQVVIIYGTIVGACAFLVGMGLGILIGYFIRRGEERREKKTRDFDKLKRSDHFHFDRKRKKTRKPPP